MAWLNQRLVLVSAIFLIAGFSAGFIGLRALEPPQSAAHQSASSTPAYLLVERELFPDGQTDQEPHGYIVSFHGTVNQTFLLTQGIEDSQPENMPLIQGRELQTDEFDWAGVKTRIFYVRSKDQLQIQRELEVSDDTLDESPAEPLPRDVLLTLDLPENVEVTFSGK